MRLTSRSICSSRPHRFIERAPDAKRRGHGRDDIADFVIQHVTGIRSSFHLDFVTPIAFRDFRIIAMTVPSIAT